MSEEQTVSADVEMTEDMSEVRAADEAFPEGQFAFRISNCEVHPGEGTNGANRIVYTCKSQTEGESFGRSVFLGIDMGDPRGRSNLKSVYKACGYNPGPGGHNPSKVIDGEIKATVKHKISEGVTYANILPWTIKPIAG